MSPNTLPENPYFWLPKRFDPQHYYGSLHILRQVMLTISSPQMDDLELFGLPGMGKSTLLHYLYEADGAIACHRDWLQPPFNRDPQRLFFTLVEYRQKPTRQHPLAYLYQCFQESTRSTTSPCEAVLVRIRGGLMQPSPALDDASCNPWMDYMEQDLRQVLDGGLRPVLLLDDFDLIFKQLDDEETSRLRPLRWLSSFILGTESNLEEINSKAAGSPFFQTITKLRVTGLARAEAELLLSEPASQVGVTFPPEDVKSVIDLAGTHLYLTILAGQVLWDLRANLGLLHAPAPLSASQREIFQARLVSESDRTFHLYRDRATPTERVTLQRLAAGEKPDAQDLFTLGGLEMKGLVVFTGHAYQLFSPLFAQSLTLDPPLPADALPATPRSAPLKLTAKEKDLSDLLREQPGKIYTFQELALRVWSADLETEGLAQVKRRIQVTISRLKQKLAAQGKDDIQSVHDIGYRIQGG